MSVSINTVIIGGNITRDPESKQIGGSTVCNFGVAVNEVYKDKDGEKQERCHFIEVNAWGKTAELVAQYCNKGDPVLVEGKIVQESWEKDGKKQSKTKVKADRVHFLGARSQNKAGSASNGVQTTITPAKSIKSPPVADDSSPPF